MVPPKKNYKNPPPHFSSSSNNLPYNNRPFVPPRPALKRQNAFLAFYDEDTQELEIISPLPDSCQWLSPREFSDGEDDDPECPLSIDDDATQHIDLA